MKYYGGCDVGSTYTKAVILDETGKIVADTTIMSKINAEESARIAMKEVLDKAGLKSEKTLRTSSVRVTAGTRSRSRTKTSPRSPATRWASM